MMIIKPEYRRLVDERMKKHGESREEAETACVKHFAESEKITQIHAAMIMTSHSVLEDPKKTLARFGFG